MCKYIFFLSLFIYCSNFDLFYYIFILFVVGTKWSLDTDTRQENIKRARGGQCHGVGYEGISLNFYFHGLVDVGMYLSWLQSVCSCGIMADVCLSWRQLQSDCQWSIFLLLQKQKPLLIVVEDLESDVLGTLILNRLRGGIKVGSVSLYVFVAWTFLQLFLIWHEM